MKRLGKEIWRPVVGFVGVYEVSDYGRVRSLSRESVRSNGHKYFVRGQIRVTPVSKGGYLIVMLCCDGTKYPANVHSLVARAFIGPRPKGKEVAHRDGNRLNAALYNLRYATPVENDADKIQHGTRSEGERNGHARLTSINVITMRKRVAAGESQRNVAADYNVCSSHICKIINRKLWTSV
jgi:hypothetical protein